MQRLHHRGPADGRPRHPIDRDYFSRIASTLNHVGGTLLTGPGEARFELARYLSETRPDLLPSWMKSTPWTIRATPRSSR